MYAPNPKKQFQKFIENSNGGRVSKGLIHKTTRSGVDVIEKVNSVKDKIKEKVQGAGQSSKRKSDWDSGNETPTEQPIDQPVGVPHKKIRITTHGGDHSRIGLFASCIPIPMDDTTTNDNGNGTVQPEPVVDQELPFTRPFGVPIEQTLNIDLSVGQLIDSGANSVFYLPFQDPRVFFDSVDNDLYGTFSNALYWRPLSVDYTMSDFKCLVVPNFDKTVSVPIRLSDVKMKRLNHEGIVVGDFNRIFNASEDLHKMKDIVSANRDDLCAPLPRITMYWNNYVEGAKNTMEGYGNTYTNYTCDLVPKKFPLWEALVVTDEVPKFSYKWTSKCKMLRSCNEWLEPRMNLKYDNLEFTEMHYGFDRKSEPKSASQFKTNGILHKVCSFDYGNGYYNLPRGGIMDNDFTTVSNNKTHYWRRTVGDKTMIGELTTDAQAVRKYPYTTLRRNFVNVNSRLLPSLEYVTRQDGADVFRPKMRTKGEFRSALLGSMGVPETKFGLDFGRIPNLGDNGYVPFQSDNRIKPAIFKAEVIHNGNDANKIVPYYLEFTVHLKYKVLVYEMDSRNVDITHNLASTVTNQDSVLQQHFRNHPVFSRGTFVSPFDGVKREYDNGHWRMYTPVAEYHVKEGSVTKAAVKPL